MNYNILLLSRTSISTVLPAIPTRAQVCGYVGHFQGINYDTQELGTFPGFMVEVLNDGDMQVAFAKHKSLGDTHVTMSLVGSYFEPSAIYPDKIKEGHDHTHDLSGIKTIVRKALCAGLFVDFSLGGDGRSKPKNSDGSYPYNDPVGHTYGYEWLMDNLARILKAFRGDSDSECPDGEDLTKYVLFRPGYDGVFYGWGNLPDEPQNPDLQPKRVFDLGKLFRSILPNGYLAIEHDTGHIPCGEGGSDYSGGMQTFDVIMSEFNNWPTTGDPAWQIAGRLLGPAYRRPSDQPSSDDPNPPFYLGAGTPRGPYFAVGFEYAKYSESHGGGMSIGDVAQARAYYANLGYTYLG